MSEQITSESVLNVTFRTTKLRVGYDLEDVDDFLDRVLDAIRAREAGAQPSLRAAEVAARTFRVTKFREGYDCDQVDAFLAKVVASLELAEAQSSATPLAFQADASSSVVTTAPPSATYQAAKTVAPEPSVSVVEPSRAAFPRAASLEPILGLREVTSQLQIARIRAGLSDGLVVLAPDGTRLRVSNVEGSESGVVITTTVV